MGRFSRTIVAIGYLLVVTVLVIDATLVYSRLMTITRNNRLIDHSRQVITQLERVLSLLKDAETGQRGYLLTGRDEYLKPFRAAETELNPELARLRSLTADHDAQSERTAALGRLTTEKMTELRETIALRTERGMNAALDIVLTGQGKSTMNEARGVVADSQKLEDQQMQQRTAASQAAVRGILITFALTTGVAVLLLLAVSYLQRLETLGRERAAAAVRRSEAWMATTLTSIGDGLIATDKQGYVRLINPVAQALTGWSQEEAAGKRMEEVFTIINEQSRQPVENPVGTVIREGRIVGLANHTILVARDGTERPIDDSAAPIRDEAGNVSGVVLVFRDVAERKQQQDLIAEQKRLAEFGRDMGFALTESTTVQEMLRRCAEVTVLHLDAAFARIWTLDEGGAILELQASAGMYTHIDGRHSQVPVGKHKIGRIAQERRPHLTNAVVGDPAVSSQDWAVREEMVAFAGYPLVVEDRLVGVWAMFARHPVSGITLRAMESVASAIALGIERKRAEEALRKSEAWLSTTLASIGDAVLATDDQARLKFLNPVAQSLTGWTQEEALGRVAEEVFQIINEESRQPAESPVARVIQEGIVLGLANHTVLVSRNGTETPIDDSASPILDQKGHISGVVLVFRDITERKRRDEERERLLADAQAARADAEEANRAKDQFLAVLSHELRTPLNPILLATTAMLERPTPAEEVRPNLEMIRQNVNIQARLIDDLLDVMRIVRGKMPLHWEVADCHDVIRQAVEICRSAFLGKGLDLTVELAATRHHINADPARLQQVFWNLVQNAVKFTPFGGTIRIQTRNNDHDDPHGNRLIVDVTDSGIGIEPMLLTRIFDAFQQGESSITRRFGGMGLGLAISKGIIEGHGGLLSAQSQGKDQGTTFTIELQALAAETRADNGRSSGPASTADSPTPSCLKILLVEDEQTTLRLMSRLVRGLGHEVTTAGTISLALALEPTGEFDLIISDIGLPDGSGLELMRQVVARRGAVPAIALTGYGMEEDIQRSRDAGFSAHMTKPIDFAKLKAMIRQVAS